jgi:hypothetical protein
MSAAKSFSTRVISLTPMIAWSAWLAQVPHLRYAEARLERAL